MKTVDIYNFYKQNAHLCIFQTNVHTIIIKSRNFQNASKIFVAGISLSLQMRK